MTPTATRSTAALLLALCTAATAQPALPCSARSGATVTPVVELYTSEGCSSCPPADRWLSRLPADSPVVALAFHVDYWDRLGWKDRYASAAHTQRQAQQQLVNGARFSYTPQVVVDGADRKDWPGLAPAGAPRPARVALTLARAGAGAGFQATVLPDAGAPARLAAYWAVTEHGHVTPVQAGENAGATLRHDHVVREYRPVPAWPAVPGVPVELRFEPGFGGDAAHARHVNLVVVDALGGRPVQALKLACPAAS